MILVTVSANLLIFPYVVYSFGYYNVLGIFVSILVSGLIPLIMLFGFLSGVMSNVSFILAKPFGLLADCGVDAMSFIVSHTHRASISIDLGLFGLGVLLATLYLFFVLLEMYF